MSSGSAKRRLRDWIDTKIGNAVRRHPEYLPVRAVKYMPHRGEQNNYELMNPIQEPVDAAAHAAVPPRHLWHGYAETEEGYLASGSDHVEAMMKVLCKSGFALADGQRVLDFGCASGRMTRHLMAKAESCEIWGTDINAQHIYWCQAHLSPPLHFATTTTIPHLPFEDRYFDLIYAGSVFTHIDDLADSWLLELRRILRPEGRLYLTIHDERSVELLETSFAELRLAKELRSHVAATNRGYDFGMLVLGRDTHSQVFYSREFFRRKLGAMFQVLLTEPEAYGYQTALVLKRE